jgi:cell wall-associated NlpC family hydrolase
MCVPFVPGGHKYGQYAGTPPAPTVPYVAIPLLAVAGLCVGGLATGCVLLGGAVTALSVGPPDQGAPPAAATSVNGPPSAPVLNPAVIAAAQAAAAQCPGLDWTLVAGGVLLEPSLSAGLASVATDLCNVAPSGRAAELETLLSSPTLGEVAVVLAHALNANPELDTAVATAITFAAANLGAPYRWGGTGPGGFDCSGLTQAAYKAAHITIPRVAQDQYDAGPLIPTSATPQPGDLLFFGGSVTDISHVGLYIGGGDMIDAPHTGAFVRIEPTPTVPGQRFGADTYVGATRPYMG